MVTQARFYTLGLAVVCMVLIVSIGSHAQTQATGEIHFIPATKAEKSAGVWIDGEYRGYLGEFTGNKKVVVAAGEHEVVLRLFGYKDLTRDVKIARGGALDVSVQMQPDPRVKSPAATAEVKIHAAPDDAAVYVDGNFVGSVHDFCGIGKAMLLAPGKHLIRISLPGYQDYETQVNLDPNEKYRIETKLALAASHAPTGVSAKKD
jgi:hypothetical protein